MLQTDRIGQWSDSIGRTILQMVAQKLCVIKLNINRMSELNHIHCIYFDKRYETPSTTSSTFLSIDIIS